MLTILSGVSLLVGVAVVVLWMRSYSGTTDVFMIPLGQQRQLMFTSHSGRWFEVTFLERWPAPVFDWWSGPGWKNVGPFKFWQSHRANKYGEFWMLEGQMAYPLESPGGPPSYERGYDQAVAFGYPGRAIGTSADWGRAIAREIRVPYTLVLIIGTVPGILLLGIFLRARRKQRQRFRNRLCLSCGYDLRATPERCPECGREAG